MRRKTEVFVMNEDETCEIEDMPVSALLSVERKDRYGSVPGLDDEELAVPDELERQVYTDYFGPIMRLPRKSRGRWIQPNIDENGRVDWGAFATVDFARMMPEFDKARYKADRLREKFKDTLIMLGIVKERLPGKAKDLVLKYLEMGVIKLEHIANGDMLDVAQLYLKARRLQKEIAELREASRARRRREVVAVLG